MMNRRILTLAAACATVAVPAITPQARASGSEPAIPEFNLILSAKSAIGTEVRSPGDSELGTVTDVLVMGEGAPLALVVSVGGVLGIGDKEVAIPYHDIDTSDDGQLVLDATETQLKARMPFDYDNPTIAALAPIGFGAIGANDASAKRGAYLEKWDSRVEGWSNKIESGARDLSAESAKSMRKTWKRVEARWNDVRFSAAKNWDKATSAFESAYGDFVAKWLAEGGEQPEPSSGTVGQ